MFGKLISNIFAILKQAFAGEIVDNQLNSLYLAIATIGHRIQSRTLQIPDRLGLFSPGPPRLQVHEGCSFLFILGWTCLIMILDAYCVYSCRRPHGECTCQLGAVFLVVMVPHAVIFWIASVYDRHRAPGYEWADWKLRKD